MAVEVPALEARAPDVQAAMSVLGRRLLPLDGLHRLNLVRVDLRNARLKGADLREVEMFGGQPLGRGPNLAQARAGSGRAVERRGQRHMVEAPGSNECWWLPVSSIHPASFPHSHSDTRVVSLHRLQRRVP